MMGSMEGMSVHTSAVAASCTASRFCRASVYGARRGPSRSSSSACVAAGTTLVRRPWAPGFTGRSSARVAARKMAQRQDFW
jgi:hypothetical protein